MQIRSEKDTPARAHIPDERDKSIHYRFGPHNIKAKGTCAIIFRFYRYLLNILHNYFR